MPKNKSGKRFSLFKILLQTLGLFFTVHTLIRFIRHFYSFPIPEFLLGIIDHPLRRKIQPPDKTVLQFGVRKGQQVLEIGPGSGRYSLAAARRIGETGRLCIVDIEPKVIQKVQAKANQEGLKNVDARVADVYQLPYKKNSFDLIYLMAVIGEIPEPEHAIKEFQRVLKPEGKLVFCELFMDPDYPLPSRLGRLVEPYKFRLEQKRGNFFIYTLIFSKTEPQKTIVKEISVGRSREEARTAYDRLSKVYDLLAASEKKYIQQGLDLLNVQTGENVLEIGCGSGFALEKTGQKFQTQGNIVGLDISLSMLKTARRKIRRKNLKKSPLLIQSDSLPLPMRSDYFDAVFISFTLELFEQTEINSLLQECRRVLNEQGRIVVVAMAKSSFDPFPVKIYEWFHSRYPAYADCRPIHTRYWLEQNGFSIQKCEKENMWGLPLEIILAEK